MSIGSLLRIMISYNLHSWTFLLLVVRVFVSFITAFLAIFLWKKTRQSAQIFLVMAFLSMFIDSIYDVLLTFGFFASNIESLGGFPIFVFIFSLAPYVFFILSLIFFIREN